ncbi:hypothetical protein [Frankia sp. CIT1]|uniref:hypothetical protein n=1 Tax=Frankia sp. CIT1 TaxID=2880974 RepID=UPI001EF5BF93|nr:hypothetical protein [Frankia sp. CIT1]
MIGANVQVTGLQCAQDHVTSAYPVADPVWAAVLEVFIDQRLLTSTTSPEEGRTVTVAR